MRSADTRSGEWGYFIPATIIDNPPATSRIVQEEQFGPVLPLIRFTDIEEVIATLNDCSFALGASIWSTDEAEAARVTRRLTSGTV
ncbi:aldehyde dehydrogenase family protein [uncultured Sphingomonas sp.]|uniref:aldehyde dehydrogenase family protein n=1 Tax=uncultured Sphingomonas sp. TaxID=158754 RepID=UPI003456358B